MKKIYFYKIKGRENFAIISTGLKYDRELCLMYGEIVIHKQRSCFVRNILSDNRFSSGIIILDIYEILFNKEYIENLKYLINFLFDLIDDTLPYSKKLTFYRNGIKKEKEAINIYIQLIKDIYKLYKNIFLDTELGEFYERIKNL